MLIKYPIHTIRKIQGQLQALPVPPLTLGFLLAGLRLEGRQIPVSGMYVLDSEENLLGEICPPVPEGTGETYHQSAIFEL